MKSFSLERKEANLQKMAPPQNMSVAELSRLEGVSEINRGQAF